MLYFIHIAMLTLLRFVTAQSMNLYLGFTGVLALSHAAFVGIGAYTYSILLVNHDVNFFLAVLAAAVVTAISGFLIGLTSIRLWNDYLGIATFGFAVIVLAVMQNWVELTNGVFGIAGIPRPTILGVSFAKNTMFIWLILAFVFVLMFVMYRIVKSPFGRVLETIRDDEEAAKNLGIRTNAYKLAIFSIGAGMAGIVGGLSSSLFTYIDPKEFTPDLLAITLVMVLVGGMGTFRGPIIGALIITGVTEGLRFLPIPDFYVGSARLMIYSAIFLVILRFLPEGIGGFWKRGSRRKKQQMNY